MKTILLYLLFLSGIALLSPRLASAQGACNCDSSHGVCNMTCCSPEEGCHYTNTDSCCRRTCNSSYICKTVSGEGSDQCDGENTSCGSPPTSTPIPAPTSTPAPSCQTKVWNEETCGWSGSNWCGLGSCNTGWVSGPSVSLKCPSNQILRNDGTYCSRWDGKKSFVGTVSCVTWAACAAPTATRTPTPRPTNTPIPTATRTPTPRPTNTPVPGAPTSTRTPTPRPTNTPVPGAPTATRTVAPRPTNTPGPSYPLCDASCGVCGVRTSASACYTDWGNGAYGLNCCHMECVNSPQVCTYVDGGGPWNCAACASSPTPTPTPATACDPIANPAGLVCDIAGNRISWNPVVGAEYYPLRVDDSPNSFYSWCTPTNPGDVCEDVNATYRDFTFEPGITYDVWVHSISSCDGSWGVGWVNRITCAGPNGPPSMARLTVANSVGTTIASD